MTAWQRRSTRLVHSSRHFELHEDVLELPSGNTMVYTRFEGPSFATIIPVTDRGEIVFVQNYRPPLRRGLLELPGGMVDEGESPAEAAARELEEETGFVAGKLRAVGWFFPSPHLSAQRGHLYLATDLSEGVARPEESESLRTVRLPIATAYARLAAGKIHQSTAMLGLYVAEPFLRELVTGAPSSPASRRRRSRRAR